MRTVDELLLRIVVLNPPPGVEMQVQRGPGELTGPVRITPAATTFEIVLRLGTRPNGDPNFLGPYAQGPPGGRFVYVNSGTLAGQSDSCWTRRAKIPLTSITWALIDRARSSKGVLTAEMNGTGRDGGPSCASVPLRGSGWHVVPE